MYRANPKQICHKLLPSLEKNNNTRITLVNGGKIQKKYVSYS